MHETHPNYDLACEIEALHTHLDRECDLKTDKLLAYRIYRMRLALAKTLGDATATASWQERIDRLDDGARAVPGPQRLPEGRPYSVDEMKARDWKFDNIVMVPLAVCGDIEKMNDFVSQAITGTWALQDIGYEQLHSVIPAPDCVALRVTGSVSDPQDHWPDQIEVDAPGAAS